MTSRRRAALLVAGALLAGGCSVSVPGTPTAGPDASVERTPPPAPTPVAPTPAAPAPAPPEPSSTAPAPPRGASDGCRIAVSGTGSISMSGSGGRAVTRNGATSFSCRNGPLVAITSTGAAAATFSLDGSDVEVAEGATGVVGPYQITVVAVDGGAVRFEVVPGG